MIITYKKALCCLVLLFILMLCVPSAHAAGHGLYLDVGRGYGEWDIGTGSRDYDASIVTSHFGAGYVFDTQLATRAIFNYRLSAGYERFLVEDGRGPDFEYNGLSVMNDFGLGIIRGSAVRVWLGPCVKVAYYTGEREDNDSTRLFVFGAGPVAGVNIRLGTNNVFVFKLGYTINANIGGGETGDIWGGTEHLFMNAGILFD